QRGLADVGQADDAAFEAHGKPLKINGLRFALGASGAVGAAIGTQRGKVQHEARQPKRGFTHRFCAGIAIGKMAIVTSPDVALNPPAAPSGPRISSLSAGVPVCPARYAAVSDARGYGKGNVPGWL
ncbi:hypothetical protein, partial [Cupriavidus sp.]|uniref:hypothetical protein n=1 Tax=Cupriavidus sp. TaxID=1873897 RepID=UPI003D0F44AB